jgi:co-chaperonin GroES (HSP10)
MKPVFPYVIVSVVEPEKKEELLYKSEGEVEATHLIGTVLASGENKEFSAFVVGSRVLFAKKDLRTVLVDGAEYKFITEGDVIAVASL